MTQEIFASSALLIIRKTVTLITKQRRGAR